MTEEQQTMNLTEAQMARRALLYKKSLLREEVIRENWTDDKFLKMGNGGFGYVTTDKLKRILAPMFHRNGLEFTVDYDDLQFRGAAANNSQWWTVRAIVKVTDIDTGEYDVSYAYGEGSSNSEKGVAGAQAIALKQWFLHNYLLVDGIEADRGEDQGSYYKKSPEEQDEIRSNVLSRGIAPPQPREDVQKRIEELKKRNAARNAPVEAPEAPVEAPKEETPAETVTPVETPAETPKEAPKAAFVPNALQKKTMDNIVAHYNDLAKEGKVSVEDYNRMSMDKASISNHKEAVEFISKYKDVLAGE